MRLGLYDRLRRRHCTLSDVGSIVMIGTVNYFADIEVPKQHRFYVTPKCGEPFEYGLVPDVRQVRRKLHGTFYIITFGEKYYRSHAIQRGLEVEQERLRVCRIEHMATYTEMRRFEWEQPTFFEHLFEDKKNVQDSVKIDKINEYYE